MQVVASVALLSALLALGAGSAGASSGVVIKEPQYGFSFDLPPNWKQVPLDGTDVTALLNEATHDDPALTDALNSQITSAASRGMKVFAIGPVVGSATPNVNVIVVSSAGSPPGRAFAQAAVAEAKIELTQAGADHLKTSIVNDRLGDAAQVTYILDAKVFGGTEFGTQYYVRHNSSVLIVTVTTSSQAGSQSVARGVVSSWRWS